MPIETEREADLQAQMVAYQEGRVEAFDALYAALAPEVRACLLALCRDAARADDLVQETFLQIHRSRAAHMPGEPVRPWVYAIATRVFLMYRRSAVRRARATYQPGLPVRPWARGIAKRVFLMDRRSAARRLRYEAAMAAEAPMVVARAAIAGGGRGLARALAGVPSDARRPFLLHHLFGFSFAEVATRLGIRTGAAKVRSSRARLRLRALLNGGADAD